MSEEVDVDTGLKIMEDEQVNEEKESPEKSSLLGKHQQSWWLVKCLWGDQHLIGR